MYRPHCQSCNACIPVQVYVAAFHRNVPGDAMKTCM
ncbi:MAG: hypothetical protein M3A44_11080 [Gammaproteobacteria bacterium]